MSLKALHLFVVVAFVVACCAYGMWCVFSFLREGNVSWLLTGLLPLLSGLALLMHGVIFYKRTEEEPWL